MKKFREESDSIGTLKIPVNAYYGVQSLRAANNFNITTHKMNIKFIYNITKIKKAAAIINNRTRILNNNICWKCDFSRFSLDYVFFVW